MDFQALSERLKDAPDSGYNGQMPLATLKDQNKSLSVPEILHLLRLAFTNHLVPAISYHSIKLLTFIHCTRTPPSRGRTDPKPLRHFDPLLPRNVYAAWLFDSCIPL